MWTVRYHLSRWLLSASLYVMPRGAYRTELRRRIYDFKNEVMINAMLDYPASLPNRQRDTS